MSRLHHFDEGAAEHLIGQYVQDRGDEANFDDYHSQGRCHLASEDFVAYARLKGHTAHMIERTDTGSFRGEHVATVVHGMGVIDPTSAQLGNHAYETAPFDPAHHEITGGWYGSDAHKSRILSGAVPKKLLRPQWPANKPWDDLPKSQQDKLTKPAPWVRW